MEIAIYLIILIILSTVVSIYLIYIMEVSFDLTIHKKYKSKKEFWKDVFIPFRSKEQRPFKEFFEEYNKLK